MGKRDLDNEVLNLLPISGSEIRAKDIYEEGARRGLSKITIERKLKELANDGLLNRRDAGHMQVYYSRLEKVRIQRLVEDFKTEIISSFDNFPDNMGSLIQGVTDSIAEDLKKRGIDFPEEAKEGLMKNKVLVEEMGFLTFVNTIFEVFKTMHHTKVSRIEPFFIDNFGIIVPSAEVYKRFSQSEINGYNKIST